MTYLLLAVGRAEIADYVGALFSVYFVLILLNILLSWIPRIPYNRFLYGVIDFINEVTNPYLNLFRRFIPPLGGGGFALDLSPILGLIVLGLVRGLVVGAIDPN
ncbi:MAG: YggT family protein [bacterium]